MKSKKLRLCIKVMGLVAVMILVFSALCVNSKYKEIDKLKRPDYSSQRSVYSLTAKVEEEEYQVEINVEPMKISDDMLQSYFDEAFDIVCEEMLGNNEAFDCVKSNLNFVEKVEKYGIKVSYHLSDYSVITSMGEVNNIDMQTDVKECEITITLEYEDKLQSYIVRVCVYPPDLTEEQRFVGELAKSIQQKNMEKGEEYINLPNEIGGKKVTFVEKAESKMPLIIILLLLAAVFWYYRKFVVKKNLEKLRDDELMMDYPELVSKLSLLMGAGMSEQNALNKIAKDYKAKLFKNGKRRFVYEEIVTTINRISSGISEADAYAQFGRACKNHSYIKLSGLMVQNIRKGGEGFNSILRNEVTEAFLERKSRAKRAGEEAGTKLLLPMGMMLCVVLVVIIVPAFMSF